MLGELLRHMAAEAAVAAVSSMSMLCPDVRSQQDHVTDPSSLSLLHALSTFAAGHTPNLIALTYTPRMALESKQSVPSSKGQAAVR